ncbi:MAG: PEP-CTERM sorting domain-containing protein [Pseudomonadota bacterium]
MNFRALKRIALLVIVAVPMTAQAGLLRYEFSGSNGAGDTLDAFFTVDSSVASTGSAFAADIISYGASWTIGGMSFGTGSSQEPIFGGSGAFFDVALNITSAFICSGATCNPVNHPEFFADTIGWGATNGPNPGQVAFGLGSWSGPIAVPAPGVVGLLALGLLGLYVRRRAVA